MARALIYGHRLPTILVLASRCLPAFLYGHPAWSNPERLILGRIEDVVVQSAGVRLKARIDTGAGVSSINAKIVEIKPVPGGSGERVVFTIKDHAGRTMILEQPVSTWMEIKGKGTTKPSRRPVVMLDFCLGGKLISERVNLANRSRFLYPVLIGRNMIKAGDFLVDPKRTYVAPPECD